MSTISQSLVSSLVRTTRLPSYTVYVIALSFLSAMESLFISFIYSLNANVGHIRWLHLYSTQIVEFMLFSPLLHYPTMPIEQTRKISDTNHSRRDKIWIMEVMNRNEKDLT
ncbi:hypothetical protein GQX74_007466 [Glossina fuscipes]|nr:hypothetical protein GQX74_007466 [Glossina fuscipes]